MMKKAKIGTDIMVCVTGQRSCDRLMAWGAERAAELGGDARLHVVHCVETGRKFMNAAFESDAIEYLFTAAQLAGADLSLLRAENVDDALVDYALEHDVDIIILGEGSAGTQPKDHIAIRLQRRLPNVRFDVVPSK